MTREEKTKLDNAIGEIQAAARRIGAEDEMGWDDLINGCAAILRVAGKRYEGETDSWMNVLSEVRNAIDAQLGANSTLELLED